MKSTPNKPLSEWTVAERQLTPSMKLVARVFVDELNTSRGIDLRIFELFRTNQAASFKPTPRGIRLSMHQLPHLLKMMEQLEFALHELNRQN